MRLIHYSLFQRGGSIRTPLWDAGDEKMKQQLLAKLPSGKIGEVDDISDAVMFFAVTPYICVAEIFMLTECEV